MKRHLQHLKTFGSFKKQSNYKYGNTSLNESSDIIDGEFSVFNYLGEEFKIKHIHTNSYRLTDKKTNTWQIVHGEDIQDAQKNAKGLLDIVFGEGRPNFYPKKGDKFVVTGDYFNSDTNTFEEIDKISFREGTHWQLPGGTGTVYAKKGDIITFDRQGEDNGFWYLDGDKKVDSKYYFKYEDGSSRYSVKGPKPWHLLWSAKIKSVK